MGQTAAKPATVHHAAEHSAAREGGCVTVPELSPKIPALPAGAPCPRALYTVTRKPDVVVDYRSPLEGPDLLEQLNAVPSTVSLVYVDTLVGTGPLAEPGMYYTVNYTGYLTNGTKFDSSLDRGEPISFPHGQHRVIPGWDTGFAGMHVGGKRRLYIPYQLAYGEQGHPPVIPAKSELVFDVELVGQSATQPPPQPRKTPPPMPHPTMPARPNPGATTPGSTTAPATGAAAPAATTAPANKPQTK
jgi:peptidylprolyl isomerase